MYYTQELETAAGKTMTVLTEAFGDWCDWCKWCEHTLQVSELHTLAQKKMDTLAGTFDYCYNVYSRAPEDSKLRTIAERERDKILAKINRHFN